MNYAHLGFAVKDLEKSKVFYDKALAPLGLSLIREKPESVHFGQDGRTLLYVHAREIPPSPFHMAFEADTQEQVDAFYATALAAGGVDHGAPGIRSDYSPTYYAAFVIDPDGHNIEVVHRG